MRPKSQINRTEPGAMPRTSRVKPQLGIGIDVERVDRFRNEMQASSRFLSSAFTERERAYCMAKADPSIHFAGTFAVKEAAFKALNGLHLGRMVITDFEVSHGGDGAPRVKHTGAKAERREVDIKVSVSHTADIAVAVVVAVLYK
jgi:phosphopantetheine--protein transferase-like protein